jgi:hypothetical protein
MAIVVSDMSMSLDGFVAGPNDEVDQVFSWMMGGDVAVESENRISGTRSTRRAWRSSRDPTSRPS